MPKKIIFSFLFSLLAVCVFAADPAEALDKFLNTSGVPQESLAVKVIDLEKGKNIISLNNNLPLVPASIMKSVTSAALFNETGSNWKYHTKVFIDGPVDMGKLRGNLIIVGGADPSLHSDKEPYGTDLVAEITNALIDLDITAIEGDIIIDESEFAGPARPESWAPGDHKKYYGTGSHAFNFANNATGDNAVENPSALFLNLLSSSLNNNKIRIESKNLGEGKRRLIFDHVSPPIDEIMRSCMMRSDNLFAECFLRTYGKLKGGDGSTSAGAAAAMASWSSRNLPMEGINIVDGSGLSRKNRLTVNFMGELLSKMSKDATYASFFPLAGQEGTMRKFLAGTELDSYIAMKTGSMTGILCYAGYKLDDDYAPTHVIVVMLNDVKGRDKAKTAVQQLLLDIFADN